MTGLRLAGLGFGVLFGFTLGWARLTEYDTIRDMLLLREPDVFLLMGSAVATGFVGTRLLRALRARSWIDGTPVAWTTAPATAQHVRGAALFGLGWSLACSCPGPVAAQLGRGQLAGLFTAAGLFVGVALAGRRMQRARSRTAAEAAPAAAAGACAGL